MRAGGLAEATGDGARTDLRDRLQRLLLGGCGRSFATQRAAFQHMQHCCPGVLDPAALAAGDPATAAAAALAVQGDAGLGGVDLNQVLAGGC